MLSENKSWFKSPQIVLLQIVTVYIHESNFMICYEIVWDIWDVCPHESVAWGHIISFYKYTLITDDNLMTQYGLTSPHAPPYPVSPAS